MENKNAQTERFFSVELKSKANLKTLNFEHASASSVLIEGTLGELLHASFVEEGLMEISGSKGTLRLNLSEHEFTKPQREVKPCK